jgi:hypothetical protein
MSTLRLKYVQAWIDRDGRVHRYFRRPGYQRIRLPGLPGSAEFMRAYEAAQDAAEGRGSGGRVRLQRAIGCRSAEATMSGRAPDGPQFDI